MGCSRCIVGSGPPTAETRILNAFTTITLKCSADVVLKPIAEEGMPKVIVSAPANLIPMIVTTISEGILTIDIEGCIASMEKMEIQVFANNLSAVINEGSGDIFSRDTLSEKQFSASVNGSGDIEMPVKAQSLNILNNGSGDITMRGNTGQLNVQSNGSGDCNLSLVKSNNAEVALQGSGDVSVEAISQLDIVLNGSGDVKYSGKAAKINKQKNGSGEIFEAQ